MTDEHTPRQQERRPLPGVGDSLGVRLVLAIVLFSALSTLVSTAIQFYYQYRSEISAIQVRLSEFRKLQVPVLAESVWAYEDDQILAQLNGITQLPFIEAASIRVGGEIKWGIGNADSRRVQTEKFPLHRGGEKNVIGVLEVAVSLDQVQAATWRNAADILLQNALQTLIIAGFALVFFQRSVTRHIYQMASYTRQLDIQQLNARELVLQRPSGKYQDVIEELATSINTMRRNLGDAYRDLTAYTAEVMENKKKFLAIFNSSPVALSVSRFHEQYFLMEVNEAWEHLFSLPREQAINRDIAEIQFWKSPEECAHFLATMEKDGEVRGYEVWRRRGDGELLLCEISARLFEVGGECLLLMAEMDMTEKRRNEEAVRDLNVSLEGRVEERTAELRAANAQLSEALEHLQQAQDELLRSEKLAALGSLVAGIAHELNTPIGNSMMVASTLGDQTKQINRAFSSGLRRSELEQFLFDASEASEQLQRNLYRASELINSFKQVAVDQTSSQRREFDLAEVVGEILLTLRPMLKKTPYVVDCDIAPDITMDSYPGPFGQVLTNLIQNAILHGFDGALRGRLQVQTRQMDDHQIELKVTDNGKGIPEAHMRRIFDPFFTTKLGQGGSGLGLNVVHTIVTGVLGGHITVDSVPGQGTCFTVIIPNVAPKVAKLV